MVDDPAIDQDGVVLSSSRLSAGYHGTAAVHDLDIEVRAGEVVALVGANGAGKSTALNALAGVLPPLAGTVRFLGSSSVESAHRRARRGMSVVADDRSVFRSLSVGENLRLGQGSAEAAFEYFPELIPLRKRRVELLSGGEQQMLSLGRALAAGPRAILADELSLGLAPQVTHRLHRALRSAAASDVAVLVVEQQIDLAMASADRIYVLSRGRVVMSGRTSEVQSRLADVEAHYLGVSSVASGGAGGER